MPPSPTIYQKWMVRNILSCFACILLYMLTCKTSLPPLVSDDMLRCCDKGKGHYKWVGPHKCIWPKTSQYIKAGLISGLLLVLLTAFLGLRCFSPNDLPYNLGGLGMT